MNGAAETSGTNNLDSVIVLIYICTESCNLVELLVEIDTSSTDIYTVTIVKQYRI